MKKLIIASMMATTALTGVAHAQTAISPAVNIEGASGYYYDGYQYATHNSGCQITWRDAAGSAQSGNGGWTSIVDGEQCSDVTYSEAAASFTDVLSRINPTLRTSSQSNWLISTGAPAVTETDQVINLIGGWEPAVNTNRPVFVGQAATTVTSNGNSRDETFYTVNGGTQRYTSEAAAVNEWRAANPLIVRPDVVRVADEISYNNNGVVSVTTNKDTTNTPAYADLQDGSIYDTTVNTNWVIPTGHIAYLANALNSFSSEAAFDSAVQTRVENGYRASADQEIQNRIDGVEANRDATTDFSDSSAISNSQLDILILAADIETMDNSRRNKAFGTDSLIAELADLHAELVAERDRRAAPTEVDTDTPEDEAVSTC